MSSAERTPRNMTFQEGLDVFRQGGRQYAEDFQSHLAIMEKAEMRDGLPRLSIMSALSDMKSTFNKTYRSFKMVTGSDLALQQLPNEFHTMIKRLIERRGRARIIVMDGELGKFEELLKVYPRLIYDVTQGVSTNSQRKIEHFFTSDGRRAREEQPHGLLTPESPANFVEAHMYQRPSIMPEMLESRFDGYWEKLTGEDLNAPPKQKWNSKKPWWHKILGKWAN